jgi:hypothetical protein
MAQSEEQKEEQKQANNHQDKDASKSRIRRDLLTNSFSITNQ